MFAIWDLLFPSFCLAKFADFFFSTFFFLTSFPGCWKERTTQSRTPVDQRRDPRTMSDCRLETMLEIGVKLAEDKGYYEMLAAFSIHAVANDI